MKRLLKDLLQAMQGVIDPKVGQDVLVRFFLGEENEWINDSVVNKIKNGKINLDSDKRESLVKSTDYTMERLKQVVKRTSDNKKSPKNSAKQEELKVNICKLEKELFTLCKKYKVAYQPTDSTTILINRLVILCFLKTLYTEETFARKSLNTGEYVSWKNMENDLNKNIRKNHITFVCGSAACGKRQLVEYFLHNKQTSDYVFADYKAFHKKDYVQVDYLLKGIQEVSLDKFLIQCAQMEKNDYVIITWHYFEQEEIVRVVKLLEKLRAKVIIITRTNIIPEECGLVYVEKWPRKQMLEIIKRNSKSPCARNEYFGLIELLQHNPYLIKIISTYFSTNKEQSLEEFLRILKEDGVSEVIALSKGESHKIHSTYREKNKNKPTHPINAFLARCLESCSDEDIALLCRLIVWTQTVVDVEFLLKIGKFKCEEINKAIERNYLLCAGENMVQMSPTFIWALNSLKIEVDEKVTDNEFIKIYVVVNDRKIVIDENGIRTGCELLIKMAGSHECSTHNIKYYYATILNIICRYHRIYSVALNIEDRRWGEYYRFWTHFLEVAVYRFRMLGNVKQAEWINEKVYVKYARKKPSCKPNVKQESRTKLENFNLKFLQKSLTEEDWDTTIEIFKRKDIDVVWMHTAMDFFIYQEMDVILSKFIENPREKYFPFREKSVLELLRRYFELLDNQKLVDEKSNLYAVFYYYLKSIYQDRRWLECVPIAGNSVFNDRQNLDYDENCLRAQLYYVFFEMIIQWKDENVTLSDMRERFIPYLRIFTNRLETQILSLTTTNTAFLVIMLSNALLLIRKDDGIYRADFDLFGKMLNISLKQYRINAEEYKKLADTVNDVSQRIDEIMES